MNSLRSGALHISRHLYLYGSRMEHRKLPHESPGATIDESTKTTFGDENE
ncbi:MAG TPA: hypothetical protein PLZ16_06330 [Gammaproteobacteria bacterium]|nr:hypothetical protein [Gammaproteobacteria bacterium]